MTKLNVAVVCEFAPGVIRNLFGVLLAQRSADEADNLNIKTARNLPTSILRVFLGKLFKVKSLKLHNRCL